jgi:hypothetical protein
LLRSLRQGVVQYKHNGGAIFTFHAQTV